MESKAVDFMPLEEIAARIGMSRAFVYKQIRNGAIDHMRMGDGPKATLRVLRSDAEKYIETLKRRGSEG